MKKFDFNIPTKIIYGRGRIKELGENVDTQMANILIVTDKNVAQQSGALEILSSQLKGQNLIVFDEVEENPSLDLLDKGRLLAQREHINLIIGLGGGSPMDAAKGIAVLSTNEGGMLDYMEGKNLAHDPLPVICIPTSSGTGSEVTPYAVFTDRKRQTKGGFSHPKIFPQVSIVDPELTYSMPKSVIINTGLDALTHAIEAFLSTDAFELNDALALHAINIILKELPEASHKSKTAMDALAYAAMIAGITITHAGTILLHIMAYPLTVFHSIPHGKANAILLPGFLEFMKEKSFVKDKVRQLDEIFQAVNGIDAFIHRFEISTELSSYGIRPSQFDLFAKKTIIKDDIKITPAKISKSDIHDIYKSVK
jgi:1,3-propanediol dehydrogenase/alcohol dehydrogenase